MAFAGDRDATIVAMVTARAWRDPGFRDRLLSDPKPLLAAEGLEIPEDVDVRILEDTPSVKYLNLTRETTDAKQALDVLQRFVPIRENFEVRLVQSTEKTRYLVLPCVPAGLEPELMTETDLTRAAVKADGVTATGYIAVSLAAVQTQAAATTVYAAAEAIAVIVLT